MEALSDHQLLETALTSSQITLPKILLASVFLLLYDASYHSGGRLEAFFLSRPRNSVLKNGGQSQGKQPPVSSFSNLLKYLFEPALHIVKLQ